MTASNILFCLSGIFFVMGVVMTFAPVSYRRWLWETIAWIITLLLLVGAVCLFVWA